MRAPLYSFLVLAAIAVEASGEGIWGSRGNPRQFAIRDNLVYAADGRGVAVYDVSDPAQIRRVDVESRGDETNDVALLDSSDLVVATRRGIERYAIADGGALTFLASFPEKNVIAIAAAEGRVAAAAGKSVLVLEPSASGLALVRRLSFGHAVTVVEYVDQHLYVGVEREATYVFGPDSSTSVGRLSYVPVALALAGDVLWGVAGLDGLRAIDVSDPEEPETIGSVGRGELLLHGVAAAGDRVFAFRSPDQVHVFDGSQPDEPRLISTFTEWTEVIAAAGSRLFLSGRSVDDEEMTTNTGTPLRVFDASDLAAPHLLGEFRDRAGPVSGVWTDGSIAYVVDPPYLRVLDVSKTAEPREITSIEVPAIQDLIRVKNGRAVIYGRAHVNMIDLSSALRPTFLGNWDAQGHPISAAAITVQDRFAEANEHSGLHIVDYSDPSNAVQVGLRKWHYHDLAAGDDVVYLLMVGGAVLAVEIVDTTTVVDRGAAPAAGHHFDIAPPNAAIPEDLVVATPYGVRLFSLADRFDPVETDFLPTAVMPGPIGTTDAGFAYIELDGALHRLSLTTPRLPADTGYRVTSPMQISAAGEKVVVADRYFVRVFGPDTAPPPPSRRRATRH